MAILFFLLTTHLVVFIKLMLHIFHNATQGACLWQIEVLCLATLQLGYFLFYASCLAGQHGVAHTRPNAHQLWQINISGKAVVFLELTACRELQHLLYVSEIAHEIVKVVDAVFFHCVLGHEVAHESPYLCRRVADRCASGEHHVASMVLFQYGLRF